MLVAKFGIIPYMGKKTNEGRRKRFKNDQAMGVVYRVSSIKSKISFMTIIDH